jgi:two-component system, chemotaxis family, protein-glutamate methylesterase/glutaminase
VVQHIPPGFSKPLAQRLDENCPLTVTEAAEGMVMRPGCVYLAPGGHHLKISGNSGQPVLTLDDGEIENGCRPAIDVTLRSALSVYGSRALVVILTGMGRDGALGAEAIRSRGGRVFVQKPDSCTVSSMPRQTIEIAGADAVGTLLELSQWINEASQ